jgi:hypothetical protein
VNYSRYGRSWQWSYQFAMPADMMLLGSSSEEMLWDDLLAMRDDVDLGQLFKIIRGLRNEILTSFRTMFGEEED